MKNVIEANQKGEYYTKKGADLTKDEKQRDRRAQTTYYNYLKEICRLKNAELPDCA